MLLFFRRSSKKWLILFSTRGLCLIVTFVIVTFLVLIKSDRNSELNFATKSLGKKLNVILNSDPLIGYTSYTTRRLGLKPLDSQTPLEPNIQEPIINDVLSFRYPIDIDPHEKLKCRHWTNRSSTSQSNSISNLNRTLLIVVISGAGNWVKRNLIRQTWGGQSLLETDWIQMIFLIGLSQKRDKVTEERLEKESVQHGDLVQVNVVDTYENLTLKSVALLHWTHSHCPEAELVLKCDDDNYINFNAFKETLPAIIGTNDIFGVAVSILRPERYRSQRHFISRLVWPWNRYPAYLMGGCYAIAGQAIKTLLAAVQTTPFFVFEDIYITGLCTHKANVTLRTQPEFYHPDFPEEDELNPCFVRKTAIWQTRSTKQYVRSHILTEKVYNHNLPCKPTKPKPKCNRLFRIFCY